MRRGRVACLLAPDDMARDDIQKDIPAPKRGSFFIGLLIGCATVVVGLVLEYWIVGSLNARSPSGIAGDSAEPWIFLVIAAIPVAEAIFYWKLGEYRTTIGVVASSVAILGPLLWFFGCAVGLECHFTISSLRY